MCSTKYSNNTDYHIMLSFLYNYENIYNEMNLPPRKTSQTQFKTIFIFYNKFITLNYQNSTNVCFSLFFFLSALSSVRCSGVGGGGQAPQARVSSPPGGRGRAAQGEGHTPGYLHSGGETNCTKAASLPVWGGGRGKLPRIQDKSVHRFSMSICIHCSLVHARVHVHFYILVLRKG